MNRATRLSVLFVLLAAPAAADSILVRPDGSGDFPTIQDALDAARSGDEILLADGTFLGPGNRDLDFVGKAVTVRSLNGDAAMCIVDCNREGGGFRFVGGEGPASVIADLTVTRCAWPFDALETDQASPTIRNVVVSEGETSSISIHRGAPFFSGCLFEANTTTTSAAHGFTVYDATTVFEDCTLRSNNSYAMAVQIHGGTAEFRRCEFVDNRYTIITNAGKTDPRVTMEDCTFRGNDVGILGEGVLEIRNCEFRDNAAAAVVIGGDAVFTMADCVLEGNEVGVALQTSSAASVEIRDCAFRSHRLDGVTARGAPHIERCEFRGNGRAGLLLSRGAALVERCRFQGNGGPGLSLGFSSSAAVRDCLITGNDSHGVKIWNTSPVTLERCTIAGNHAGYSGGALNVWNSTVTVSRSILWGNCTGDGREVWQSASAVELSCVNVDSSMLHVFGEGKLSVTDLLEEDPGFCDPRECAAAPGAGGSWALSPDSPALRQACGPMGASGPLCAAPVGVQSGMETASWGRVKSLYR